MKQFTLRRRYFKHGTYSYLFREDGSEVCCTVEKEDKNNTRAKSCVPEGAYLIKPHVSPKFGDCYALEAPTLGVTIYGPSLRSHCLIHKANTPSDVIGCIAPGIDFGFIKGEWGVSNSSTAFNSLMKELNNEVAQLTITRD